MSYTLEELKSYIAKNVNEVDLLEILDLTSEDLVITFHDYIETNYDKLIKEFELEGDINE